MTMITKQNNKLILNRSIFLFLCVVWATHKNKKCVPSKNIIFILFVAGTSDAGTSCTLILTMRIYWRFTYNTVNMTEEMIVKIKKHTDIHTNEIRTRKVGAQLSSLIHEDVSLEDAIIGLMKALAYIEAHPEIGAIHAQNLRNTLSQFHQSSGDGCNNEKKSFHTSQALKEDHIEGGNLTESNSTIFDVFQQGTTYMSDAYESDTPVLNTPFLLSDDLADMAPLSQFDDVLSDGNCGTTLDDHVQLDTEPISRRPSRNTGTSPIHEETNLLTSDHEDWNKCLKCCRTFRNERLLNQHRCLTKVSQILRYKDLSVEKRNITAGTINLRSSRNHKTDLQHSCLLCNKTFRSSARLKKHTRKHEKQHSCPKCPKKCVMKKQVEKQYTDSCVDTTVYTCRMCKKDFTQPDDFVIHAMSHSPKRPYSCHLCDKQFTQIAGLRYHVGHKHGILKPHSCAWCGFRGTDQADLAVHEAVHAVKRFQCTQCPNAFMRPIQLEEHLNVHVGLKPHVCTVCNQAYSRANALLLHLNTHNEDTLKIASDNQKGCVEETIHDDSVLEYGKDYLLTCSNCGQRFQNSDLMEEHGHVCVSGHSTRDHRCMICNESFAYAQELKRHRRTHKHMESFVCDTCGKTFKSPSLLQQHQITHTNDRPFKCDICSKALRNSTSLRLHMLRHTGKKPHQCARCGKCFFIASNLKTHVRLRHNVNHSCDLCRLELVSVEELVEHKKSHANVKPYICQVCGKSFTQIAGLRYHVLLHHKSVSPHTCNTCGKVFDSDAELAEHHSVHVERPFGCTACDKKYMRETQLHEHMNEHSGARPFTCNTCTDTFTHSSSLRSHVAVHKDLHLIPCSICGKKITVGSMKAHEERHSQDCPVFRCSMCTKVFHQLGNLKCHMRTHTGEKPFKCPTCDKCFSHSSSLIAHEAVHTGIRPYPCSKCDRSFADKTNLRAHMRTHSDDKPHICNACGAGFIRADQLRKHMANNKCDVTLSAST